MESENTGGGCQRCTKLLPEGLPAFIDEGQIVCRACNDAARKTCPNCGQTMNRKLPATRGKCPECGESFYISTEQKLYPTGILNAAQKDAIERLRRQFHKYEGHGLTWRDRDAAVVRARLEGADVDRVFELLDERVAAKIATAVPGCLEVLTPMGVTNALNAAMLLASSAVCQVFEAPPIELAIRTAVAVVQASSRPPTEAELAQRIIEEKIARAAEPQQRNQLYHSLARVLSHYDLDSLEATRCAFREEARQCAALGFDIAEILPGGSGCNACERLAHRMFPIEDFLTNPPVPCADCSGLPFGDGERPYCDCGVTFGVKAPEA
jgi:hypothetical protein